MILSRLPRGLTALAAPLLAAVATATPASAHTLLDTVNSAGNDRNADDRITLVEAIAYLNDVFGGVTGADAAHGLGRPLSVAESNLVTEEEAATHGGVIRFQIPGAGPHVISAPDGGFPVVFAGNTLLDGYSQSGAEPNSNPITAANNATLKVVLDARVLTPHPVTTEVPDFTLKIKAPECRVRGFSVLASTATVATVPQGRHHVAMFMDNGMMDLDPIVGRFKYNLSGTTFPVEGMQSFVVASTARNADGFETTAFSDPVMVQLENQGGSADVLTSVPMQGPMVHVNIRYTADDGTPHLDIHLDPSIPVLSSLVVSQPGTRFDPLHPWFEELDPSRGGAAFNRQYGFLLDGESDPLPSGHGIRIRQLSTSPGLLVRRYRQAPVAWEPMFGQSGSAEVFEWNLVMFHPSYGIAPGARGPVTASYEAWAVDADGQFTTAKAPFELTWNVAQSLDLAVPRIVDGKVEVTFTTPTTWSGYHYQLERRGAVTGMWMSVAVLMNQPPGTHTLRDESPPAAQAYYRIRAVKP